MNNDKDLKEKEASKENSEAGRERNAEDSFPSIDEASAGETSEDAIAEQQRKEALTERD